MLSYTNAQVKAMILQPKEKDDVVIKRPKSPDLSIINELEVNKINKINADESVEQEIKEKVEFESGLIQGNQEIIENRIMGMFKNAELMRKKMPEYGYKFLMPKPEVSIEETDEEENTQDQMSGLDSLVTPGRNIDDTLTASITAS